MVAPLIAAKAYAAIQAQATSALSGGDAAGAAAGPSFGDILKNSLNDAVQSSRTAETQMAAQVQGKANLVDVVTAISSAQASLQTVMAVRDQVISAYQQVMQMQI
ncbi:MAG TPA: flagellar hook-basal body complex protein FliE [Caulobacteraceae bacterium]|nr:flagellar hook-basal body complex protein FliE [Caulobacteraceae bacterium]